MDEDASLLCRLCLKPCEDYEVIEEIHQDVFRTILLILDLTLTHEPIICKACLDSVQKCFNYTTTLSIRQNFSGVTGCLFCIQWVATDPFVLLNYQQLDVMLFKAMMGQFFPDLDLDSLENPFVCLDCYESLQTNFDFMVSCLNVEQQIKNYRELVGADELGQVDLRHVADYLAISLCDTTESNESQLTVKDGNFTDGVTPGGGTVWIKGENDEEIAIPECVSMEEILEENASKTFINRQRYMNEESLKIVKEELVIKEEILSHDFDDKTKTKCDEVNKNDKGCKGKIFKPKTRRKTRFKNSPMRSKAKGEQWGNGYHIRNR